MAKLPKYAELLAQSDEETQKEQNELAVEHGKLQLDSDILETKKELSIAKSQLKEAMAEVPFNPTAIINAQAEVEAYEEGLLRLKNLKEMFD